ncbi:PAS domain S-box protein [Metabacillus litoralis]|uniref:PAS domain S-box protein n=2 Tax=Metabacillus litoralis TaxID=152268 RepID=UPI000EF62DE5|nr:PAS domain S-box protein [Metabacillus litoralis]
MSSTMNKGKREKLEEFIKKCSFFDQQFAKLKQEAYYAMDLEGNYIRVNNVCEELTGYSKEELYCLSYNDLLVKNSFEYVDEVFHNTLNGDLQHYECTIYTKDQTQKELEVTNSPIIVDNEVIGVYGIAKDITKFNDQKLKLQESERLHRSLIEHSPDGVIITQDGRFVYANNEASFLLGGEKKEDVINKNVQDFIPNIDESHLIKCLKEAEEDGVASDLYEEKFLQLTGKEIDVEIKAIPTIFQGNRAVNLIIRDITERKLAHEVMINSEKLSVAGQLAAGIAHEIRNPITAIKGFLQLMESGKSYKQEFFSVISAEINRIEIILSELLALAKPQLDKYSKKDIKSILQHVVALTKSQAILHDVHIQTSFSKDSLEVLCDENKLKQVFINFIKNAIEAMSYTDGGMIFVKSEKVGDQSVIIKIIDQGPGIPEDILKKIGEPFFTTKENGTGLGVMVSYEIVKQHDGEVQINSDSNGTTISITLPLSSSLTS